MKIALLVPDFLSGTSFLQQPLDFLYSANLLEKAGHNVKVIDCRTRHLSFNNMVKQLEDRDLIFVTTTPCDQVQNYFLDYRYAYAVLTVNHIKNHIPKAIITVCGAHATVRPDLVLQEMNVDILIKGEMIQTAINLANALTNNTSLDEVPNIIYKGNDTYITTKIDCFLLHPIISDDLFPSYNKVNMASYFGVHYVNNVPLKRKNRAVVQGGRGCPFSCTFCHNFYGHNVNRRSPESVVEELGVCQKEFSVEEIFFLDEVFTLNRDWVLALCELIKKRNINLELTIQTRVDCIDDELLKVMFSAGVKNIWLGVESADNYVLNFSHKGIQIEATISAIQLIRASLIEPHAFFMLGMPGETVDSLNRTLKQIYDCKIPYTRSVMICTPRYGTDYYKLAVSQFPDLEEHWFNLNAVKGLVANEMTPQILQQAKGILKNRNFMYENNCPQI